MEGEFHAVYIEKVSQCECGWDDILNQSLPHRKAIVIHIYMKLYSYTLIL